MCIMRKQYTYLKKLCVRYFWNCSPIVLHWFINLVSTLVLSIESFNAPLTIQSFFGFCFFQKRNIQHTKSSSAHWTTTFGRQPFILLVWFLPRSKPSGHTISAPHRPTITTCTTWLTRNIFTKLLEFEVWSHLKASNALVQFLK